MRINVVLCALALMWASCASQIGDSCTTNIDCGTGRLCDRSQPGGYCTQSACDRIECPDEAICVDFGNQAKFCMQRCGPFAFCRDDYQCVLDFPRPDSPGENYSPFCNQTVISTAALEDGPQ